MNATPELKEEARLRSLQDYQILDTPSEHDFDDLVRLAAEICQTPISLVSLVDRHRQWFKGRYGLEIAETPRRLSFCSHAIQEPERTLIVADAAKDARFADNDLVTGEPRIRFYAGVPLVTPEGHALGTLCVIDRKPRELTQSQQEALRILGRQVLTQLELRRHVAELSRTSAALKEINAELEGFSQAVSHDLRAPLRATIGYTEVLLRRFGGALDESGRALLGRVAENSRRTEQILEDFLRMLRLRKQPLTLAPVDMQELAEEVVEELQSQPTHARIEIGNLPRASGDLGLLRQVWTNLISNALKFSRDRNPPTIEIGARTEPSQTVYFVKDNGTGFDPALADQLWTAFGRLHGREFEGTGLGLSVVRQIIQRHGGIAWAETRPGQGATFFFSLPLLPVSA